MTLTSGTGNVKMRRERRRGRLHVAHLAAVARLGDAATRTRLTRISVSLYFVHEGCQAWQLKWAELSSSMVPLLTPFGPMRMMPHWQKGDATDLVLLVTAVLTAANVLPEVGYVLLLVDVVTDACDMVGQLFVQWLVEGTAEPAGLAATPPHAATNWRGYHCERPSRWYTVSDWPRMRSRQSLTMRRTTSRGGDATEPRPCAIFHFREGSRNACAANQKYSDASRDAGSRSVAMKYTRARAGAAEQPDARHAADGSPCCPV